MEKYVDKIIVGIADIKIAKAPSVIKTSLGSCVAVCLYSPSGKVGGMQHLMMPKAPENKAYIKKAKYADTGIAELYKLLNGLCGSPKQDLVAKIFGGAKVLPHVRANIGADNVESVRSILNDMGITIVASQTGGEKGYKIEFDLSTGKVECRIFGGEPKEY